MENAPRKRGAVSDANVFLAGLFALMNIATVEAQCKQNLKVLPTVCQFPVPKLSLIVRSVAP